MKKFLVLISLLFPALIYAQKKKTGPTSFDLLIGTYTKGKSKGIYVYRFYPESGRTAYLNEIDDVSNPSYLTVANNNKFVYAVNENGKNGEVSAFKFDAKQGKLEFINKQSSLGADPCYISVDKDQKSAFVANYSSGTIAVLPINKDGSLAACVQTIHDDGHGVDKERQESAHVHTAVLSPDEKYVLYTDLGTDKLNVTRYKPGKDSPLTGVKPPFVSIKPGDGPRHLVFSNDKKHVYLLTEMGSNIHVFDYDGGKLKEKQTASFLPAGFTGKTAGAAVKLSPDGKFLYASNRLETNNITVFAIDELTGELTQVQQVPTIGKNPRDFAIDPTGSFLLVANQDSDSIFTYRIDKTTGKLTMIGLHIEIGNPVCLKFTAAE
ncbi:lactonase family protein [Mucilaginibacter sp. BJC16-A38]|uniref:lactonase family protein n=1 Tax=Mucilaginibacter phenanthrenivorans TaxID=1234842 RepID=UPI002157F612|nr:lactonase family protein [Mucilaginibacter phenanthrenivorans]MCR8559125.1 lactonase family protein [Mucilaginibacter phenanthrenivorans]